MMHNIKLLSFSLLLVLLFSQTQCKQAQIIEIAPTKKYKNFLWLSNHEIQVLSSYKKVYETKQPYSFFQNKLCNKAKKQAKIIAENKFPKLRFINYTIKFNEILYLSLDQCKVSSTLEAKNLKAKI